MTDGRVRLSKGLSPVRCHVRKKRSGGIPMLPLPAGFFQEATPLGLLLFILALLFYFLMSGKLRTNRAVQELRDDRDTRVAEWKQIAEDFKEAHRLSEEGRTMQTQIAREALEASRIQEDIVRSLRVALEIAAKDRTP